MVNSRVVGGVEVDLAVVRDVEGHVAHFVRFQVHEEYRVVEGVGRFPYMRQSQPVEDRLLVVQSNRESRLVADLKSTYPNTHYFSYTSL